MGRREIAMEMLVHDMLMQQRLSSRRTARERLKIVVICTTTVGGQNPGLFPVFLALRRAVPLKPPSGRHGGDLLRFKCPGGILRAYKQERKYTRLLARGPRSFGQRVVVSFIHS